jgi:hypothetical protein
VSVTSVLTMNPSNCSNQGLRRLDYIHPSVWLHKFPKIRYTRRVGHTFLLSGLQLLILYSVSLLVILAGTLINLSLVRFMTPTGATISQADLISVSLPSVSATLASIVNLVALIKGSVAQQRNLQSIDVPRTGDLSNSDDTDSGNTLMEHPATYLSELPGALYELPSTHGVLDEISVPRTAPSSIEYISTASMHYIWLTSTIEHCRTVYRRLTRSDTQN